jgi:hypothetical protein
VRDGRRRARVSRGPCEHRWSRGKEGTQSGRISYVRNVETPSWSAGRRGQPPGGRPIARGAEYQAGQDGREANAGGRQPATGPPGSYPGPDFHRQATTSLRTRRNTMHYVTVPPPFCWAHEKTSLKP